MGEDKFEEDKFMKALVNLKDTQESIQGFSSWCIKNRKSAYKMARCWTKVIKKVRIEQKLVLFYLVNDVVQHSSKKNYAELVDKFRGAIKEALPHLKEDKIIPKVQRCLDIWNQRDVFDEDFIKELTGLIDTTPLKEDAEIIENFQANELCKQVKIMKALEDDADYKLKTLKENDLENKDIEEIKAKLKNKSCGDEYVAQFEDGTKRMEAYIKAMDREVTKRKQVIELLSQGKKYYDSLYGEAEIVATAYTNFGNRVSKVQTKLNEKLPEMVEAAAAKAAAGSPVPSPDYDAPSPQAEDDLELKLPGEDEPGTPGTPDYPPPVSYTPPPPQSDLSARLSAMDPSNFPMQMSDQSQSGPSWDTKPNSQNSRPIYRRSRESEEREETKRSITQEAMTIPKESMSDFLTKIAHGELGGFSQDKNGVDAKRRKISETYSDSAAGGGMDRFSRPPPLNHSEGPDGMDRFSRPPPLNHNGGDWNANRSNSFLATQKVVTPPPPSIPGLGSGGMAPPSPQPWEEPVPEWLQDDKDDDDVDGEEIVETNIVLDRLRRAAKAQGGGGSNLISLTGSPSVQESGGKASQAVDMELSDGEEEDGEIIEDGQGQDDVNLSWNTRQDNHTSLWSRDSSTPPQFPPPPIGRATTTSPPPPPLAGVFNATDLNIPPPPFSVPPPESDKFSLPPPVIHSVPPPQVQQSLPSTPNSFREPPPGPFGGGVDTGPRFEPPPQSSPSGPQPGSFRGGGSFGGPPPSRGGLSNFRGPQNGGSVGESDMLNQIDCNSESLGSSSNGGDGLSQSFDELRPDFNSPMGVGFRSRGGLPERGGGTRGGFNRSFSSPEKGFLGDRGRGSPLMSTPTRGRGDFNRGGGSERGRGDFNRGGSGAFNLGGERGRGDFNRGADRGRGDFNRVGGGSERGRGGFTPRGGRGNFDGGNRGGGMRGGFDRGGGMRGGFDRGGGGMRGGFDRGGMRGGMRGMERGGGGMRGMSFGGGSWNRGGRGGTW